MSVRGEWPRYVSWGEVRAEEPRAFRSAAQGALMIVPAVITTLLCSSLGLEFRVAITLPGWLDWVHGILLIALLWLSMGLWVWALALLSLPADARRGIAIARFAKERGLRYSRHGLAPARHIMIDARGKGSLRSLLPGTQHL